MKKYLFKGKEVSQSKLNKLGYRTGHNKKGQLEIASAPKEIGNYASCTRYTLNPVD